MPPIRLVDSAETCALGFGRNELAPTSKSVVAVDIERDGRLRWLPSSFVLPGMTSEVVRRKDEFKASAVIFVMPAVEDTPRFHCRGRFIVPGPEGTAAVYIFPPPSTPAF